MAISIDWNQKIIYVPKNDLTLIQLSPVEIRELDLNVFRLTLKDLEDDLEGISYVDTHRHNTEVLLGGIVYSRIIEIINGYTVTFEDGQYAVNLVGANSNVGDVVNVNQVSVRSANSAGLISNQAIEFSTFNGYVTVDIDNITGKADSGTVFPRGTGLTPSNNMADAHLIATSRGLNRFYVIGNLTLSNIDVSDHEFVGENSVKSTITIETSADVSRCEFYDCKLTGVLDGNCIAERCLIYDLTYINGTVKESSLSSTITLAPGIIANLFECYSTVAGTSTPIIDLNETGILALRNYYGGIKLLNYTSNGSHSIDLSSGQIILDNTITSGTFVVRGIGKLIDTSGNHILSGTWNSGVTIINELVNSTTIAGGSGPTPSQIAEAVWNQILTSGTHDIVNSAGRRLREVGARMLYEGKCVGAGTTNSFTSDLSQTEDNFYSNQTLVFKTGALKGQARIIYTYDGTTKSFVFYKHFTDAPANDDEFEIIIDFTNPTADLGSQLDVIQSELAIIKGLVKHNFKMSNLVYSGNKMTSAKMKLFATAADLQNDINAIATYNITAQYNGSGQLIDYKVVPE